MSGKIKVIAFISNMGAGGAQKVVLDNAINLKNNQNIKFILCAIRNTGKISNYEEKAKEKGIKIDYIIGPWHERFFRYSLLNKFFPKIRTLYIIKRCKKYIKKKKADIVHVHLAGTMQYVVPAVKKYRKIIKFYTLHSNPYRQIGNTLNCIRYGFEKEDFIACCLNNLQYVQAKDYYGINKYEILRNGIDWISIRNSLISKKDARKQFKLADSDFVVSCVGRLDPIKNYLFMLDVIKIVVERIPNTRLLFAGDGQQKEELENRVRELEISRNVIFLGGMSNPIPVYCASDVFCLTSISESLSLVLLEAQAVGVYSVISAGVPAETIVSNNVCQMKECVSTKEWADAIIDKNFVGNAVCCEDDYDLNKTNRKLNDIYIKTYEECKK